MKHIFLILISLFASAQSFSQNQNIYFLKNNGREVNQKDSADFIRIIRKPDSGSTYFTVSDFYPNNIKKFEGKAPSIGLQPQFEGQTITFNEKGQRSKLIPYHSGMKYGLGYHFYPNGRLKMAVDYHSNLERAQNGDNEFRVINTYDSVGFQYVREGNGFAVITHNTGMVKEQGDYLNGYKNGIWKGMYQEAGRSYEEIYKKNKLVYGIQKTSNGNIIKYTQLEETERPAGIKRHVDLYLTSIFKYPKKLRKDKIKGYTKVFFDINTDGTLSNIHIQPSLNASIDLEIIRILKDTNNWIPLKIRGLPVKSSRTLIFNVSPSGTRVSSKGWRNKPI
ncbi:energy transducer TonB [Daejeonella oryzae]|uniref:energy transducer TonB n=1 Tax=Daejeonella oryzae TaxID=1122943 RepID=UPI0003FE599C|nr:energy transducer TonB [Daejeonella oryzae]